MSSNIAEDIISIKTAVVKDWEDVKTTADNINSLINNTFTWLDSEKADLWKNFESAVALWEKNITASLKQEIQTEITNSEDYAKQQLGSFIKELNSLGGDIDPASAIDKVLGELPSIPGLKDLPGIEGLDVSAFQEIVEKIFGNDFSIAIKPISPRNSAQSAAAGGSGLTQQQKYGLETLLFSALENILEDFWSQEISLPNSKKTVEDILTSTQTNIEGWITGELSTMETNVQSAVESLTGKLSGPTPTFNAKDLTDLLNNLVGEEIDDTVTVMNKIFTKLEDDLSQMKLVFDCLLTLPLDKSVPLALLYQDVFDTKDAPNLQEVISFIIAIPLTVASYATTGQNFPITKDPYNTLDQTLMTGVLQVLDIIISLADKLYSSINDSAGYPYTILMGAIGTIKSSLFQIAFLPKSTSPVNQDNALWYVSWGTGPVFSTAKWMMKAYWQKQNSQVETLKEIQTKVDDFCRTFLIEKKGLDHVYNSITNEIITQGGSVDKYSNDYLTGIATTLETVQEDIVDVADTDHWKKGLNAFVSAKINPQSTGSVVGEMKISLNKAKTSGVDKGDLPELKQDIATAITQIEAGVGSLKELASDFHYQLKNEVNKDTGISVNTAVDTFLDTTCTKIDIVLSVVTMSWKVYLHQSDGSISKDTLYESALGTAFTVLSDGADLYYAKNPPEKGSADEKGQALITNGLFAASIIDETIMAGVNLTPPKKKIKPKG